MPALFLSRLYKENKWKNFTTSLYFAFCELAKKEKKKKLYFDITSDCGKMKKSERNGAKNK